MYKLNIFLTSQKDLKISPLALQNGWLWNYWYMQKENITKKTVIPSIIHTKQMQVACYIGLKGNEVELRKV